eukprot:3085837-Rhodomonas_salina.1
MSHRRSNSQTNSNTVGMLLFRVGAAMHSLQEMSGEINLRHRGRAEEPFSLFGVFAINSELLTRILRLCHKNHPGNPGTRFPPGTSGTVVLDGGASTLKMCRIATTSVVSVPDLAPKRTTPVPGQ